MKPETRKAREARKTAETIARLLNLSVEEVQSLQDTEDQGSKAREVQAIHLFLENPEAFKEKTCQECHGLFMTNYRFASLCSTRCRVVSLEKMGITWNPQHTPENRWARTQIPTEYSIPPAALKILLLLAQDQELKKEHQAQEEYSRDQNTVSVSLPLNEPSESSPSIEQLNNDVLESQVVKLPASVLDLDEDYLL